MPPRRRPAADSLTPEDLAALTAALADGKRATVYLREATPSLGLTEGTSARVVSISGTTVTIRPRGVDDELPYEAEELRMKKHAPAPPAPKPAAAKPRAPKPAPAAPSPSEPSPSEPSPAAPSPSAPPQSASAPARSTPPPARTPAPAAAKPVTKPVAKPVAKSAAKPKSVTVTIFGSTENEWSVAVSHGGRKPAQSRALTPASVESALGALGDDQAQQAAASVLDAAREEAARKVEELRRELEAAQEALAAFTAD